MPCSGPTYDKELSVKITEEILQLLNNKYGLHNNGLNNENHKLCFDNHLKKDLLILVEQIMLSDSLNGF